MVELPTLAVGLYAAAGVHRLQRRFDEPAGKVTTPETGHHAHVNAPGLRH